MKKLILYCYTCVILDGCASTNPNITKPFDIKEIAIIKPINSIRVISAKNETSSVGGTYSAKTAGYSENAQINFFNRVGIKHQTLTLNQTDNDLINNEIAQYFNKLTDGGRKRF